MHCQMCNKAATVHLTEIINGQKTERHLCEECAQTEGITIKAHVPINEILNNLMTAQGEAQETGELYCPQCEMNWTEFRKGGLLGCPNDYLAFEKALGPLIERAHEGASCHIGRVPRHRVGSASRQVKLLRLRQDLQRAIEQEDYEAAARIRDEIKQLN